MRIVTRIVGLASLVSAAQVGEVVGRQFLFLDVFGGIEIARFNLTGVSEMMIPFQG